MVATPEINTCDMHREFGGKCGYKRETHHFAYLSFSTLSIFPWAEMKISLLNGDFQIARFTALHMFHEPCSLLREVPSNREDFTLK